MRSLSSFMLILVALSPLAAADESLSDCEADQPWIGYATTDPLRELVEPALAGQGVGLDACEGEQWDGQDGVEGANVLSLGMGDDPNDASGADPFSPGAARLSAGANEAYAAANVGYVARVAVYAGACASGEPGLEGSASCAGSRELRTGVYVRDNTPGNVIMSLHPRCFFSVIPECSAVAESDCSQWYYQYGAYNPPPVCGRDNTALGFGLVLP